MGWGSLGFRVNWSILLEREKLYALRNRLATGFARSAHGRAARMSGTVRMRDRRGGASTAPAMAATI